MLLCKGNSDQTNKSGYSSKSEIPLYNPLKSYAFFMKRKNDCDTRRSVALATDNIFKAVVSKTSQLLS